MIFRCFPSLYVKWLHKRSGLVEYLLREGLVVVVGHEFSVVDRVPDLSFIKPVGDCAVGCRSYRALERLYCWQLEVA